ncbi:MAG: hypothetical protein IRY87_23520 [Acetobacteraceae bacterium]|nr:hypothetical protein [Acetobacteraceae bacterium]
MLGLDEASAWEAMCAKLTGIPPHPFQLWTATRDRLHDRYRQGQHTLNELVHVGRTLVQVMVEAVGKRDGRAACIAVHQAIEGEATDTLALLPRAPVTNEAACKAAVRDAVRYAAGWAVHGTKGAEAIAALDAEILASDEAAIFKGSPVRAMLLALLHRLGWEVGFILTVLGQWSYGPTFDQVCARLDPADLADRQAFAHRMVDCWTVNPDKAWFVAGLGLEKLRDARTLEVAT